MISEFLQIQHGPLETEYRNSTWVYGYRTSDNQIIVTPQTNLSTRALKFIGAICDILTGQ